MLQKINEKESEIFRLTLKQKLIIIKDEINELSQQVFGSFRKKFANFHEVVLSRVRITEDV